MDMVFRYIMVALLIIVGVLGIGKFFFKTDGGKNIHQFILCTHSSGSAVDYGVFALRNNKPELVHSLQINNEDIGNNFTDAVCTVLAQIKKDQGIDIYHACFAAPGFPSAEQDYLTHWRLPYAIDAKEIIKKSGLTTAVIVNDFLAMSYGVDCIDTKDITPLYDVPAELHGRRAIIGAGDGLGSVVMIWNECKNGYKSLPAEAGTGNFPAFTQFEFDLTERMKQERNFDTCHWAFFVAVPGIQYTYKILKNMNQYPDTLDLGDPDGLTVLAHAHDDALCKATSDLFYRMYARFAYNFSWTAQPFGGLYLVGPTATDYPAMLSEIFLPEFFNCVPSKKDLLKRIPIYVINADEQLGLYGAAQYLLAEKKIFA
jgi:glucokinase